MSFGSHAGATIDLGASVRLDPSHLKFERFMRACAKCQSLPGVASRAMSGAIGFAARLLRNSHFRPGIRPRAKDIDPFNVR